MKRIPKQECTAQFEDQAVVLVTGGKTVPEVARALGLVEQTLRNWLKLAAKGKLHEGAKEITPEQMELSRLRAENVRLKLEVESFLVREAKNATPDPGARRFRASAFPAHVCTRSVQVRSWSELSASNGLHC